MDRSSLIIPTDKFIYVGIVDHTGQRFVVPVPKTKEATSASLSVQRTPLDALRHVHQLVIHGEAIECEVVHISNHARMLVIFEGMTRLDVDPEQ